MKHLFIFFLLISLPLYTLATETQLVVRVKARDAKFVGSSIGGAHIIVRNQQTGQIMAQGETEGSTGNTERIMNTPHQRGQALADEQTAKFTASLDIDEPVFLSVEAYVPASRRPARASASTQLWLIPGKPITGDGLVLEVPGFLVEVLAPRTHQTVSLAEESLKLQANVVMMCGCPLSSGGIWNADKTEVRALVKWNGKPLTEVPLQLTATSLFEGELPLERAGLYEVTIYAYDSRTGNTGLDTVNYIVQE